MLKKKNLAIDTENQLVVNRKFGKKKTFTNLPSNKGKSFKKVTKVSSTKAQLPPNRGLKGKSIIFL